MEKEKNGFSILKEEISQNNVLAMAELIAMSETRFLIEYMGSPMQKMHADLYVNILRKNDLGYVFSDSYDLVQEGALYLCEHYGKHLCDVVGYSKKGKPITIEIACCRKMMKLMSRKTRDNYRNVNPEALTPANEPYTETQEETVQDYTAYDRIVESLNLTDNMRIALEMPNKRFELPRNRQSDFKSAIHRVRVFHQNATDIYVLRINICIIDYFRKKKDSTPTCT